MFSILFASSSIAGTASSELFESLRNNIRREANPQDLLAIVDQLRSAQEQGDFDRALSLLGKVSSTNKTAEMQERCSQLQQSLFEEKRAAAENMSKEVAGLLRKTGDACLAAQNPRDLDTVGTELGRQRDALIKFDCSIVREAVGRCEKALKFVELWQKYLKIRGDNDLVEAKARLIYLANIDISHLMVERSRLVAEIEKIPDPVNKPPPPIAPSGVADSRNPDGSSEISWTNNDESADGVIIQKQLLNGKWVVLEELPPDITTLHVPNPFLPRTQ